MPYFLGEDFKTLLLYLKSAPSKLFNLYIEQIKTNIFKSGPKIPYLGIFDQEWFTGVF